jgi:c-di-GMP-binding flagellar brake protein YcgR
VGVERREQPRVSIDAFVKISTEEREYVFRTRDVSITGLFLYTRVGHLYPFKVGATLQIELYDYDQFVACKAVIVRVVSDGTGEAERYPLGFGVRIVDIAPEARDRLAAMLSRAAQGQQPY